LKASTTTRTLTLWLSHSLIVFVPYFGNALTEIHLYSPIIDQRIVHFKIGFHSLFLGRELHEGELQGVSSFWIPNDFGLDLFVKPRENELEIFILGDWIELAHKQYIFWGLNLCRR
jgi:hypothetical protein